MHIGGGGARFRAVRVFSSFLCLLWKDAAQTLDVESHDEALPLSGVLFEDPEVDFGAVFSKLEKQALDPRRRAKNRVPEA